MTLSYVEYIKLITCAAPRIDLRQRTFGKPVACGLICINASIGPLIVIGTRQGRWTMPYSRNADLPSSVRAHLPDHAQDIYRESFNHAFDAHAGETHQEERAHRIAWAAVKRSYVKAGESWVRRHP
jgi:cation transport regulator